VSTDDQIRLALERQLRKPLSDYQWKILVSQGYERAISTGERSVEEVAKELEGLRELLLRDSAAADKSSTDASGPAGPGAPGGGPRTWEEMEKLVLARTLFGARPTKDPTASGNDDREPEIRPTRPEYRRSRRGAWIAAIVIAVAVIVALLAIYFSDGSPAESAAASFESTASSAPATTVPAQTGVTGTVAGSITTVAAPTTTSASTTTTALSTTTVPVRAYVAQLSGANAVPSVSSSAGGSLTLTLSPDGSSADYVLEVSELEDVTVARMREGAAGEIGEEILTLYGGPTLDGDFTGVLAEGSFAADDLLGPLEGKTIADLVALIEAGSVYVNVGSTANPRGEIRGQLE
jgi:hypothetical protein